MDSSSSDSYWSGVEDDAGVHHVQGELSGGGRGAGEARSNYQCDKFDKKWQGK